MSFVDPLGLTASPGTKSPQNGPYKEIEKAQLPSWMIDSFKDRNYKTVITTTDMTVYRVFGGEASIGGSYVTTSPALNKIQTKIDAALLPEWRNTRHFESTILVPKETVLHVGKVAPQITKSGTILQGGSDQIILPQNYPMSWVKDVRFLN